MDSVVLLAFRIGLLVLLWFFVLMTLRALRADTKTTASLATGGGAVQTTSPAKPSIVSALKKSDAPSQLRVIEGPLVGSHMDISSLDEVVMGRSPQCTLLWVLISHRHVTLVCLSMVRSGLWRIWTPAMALLLVGIGLINRNV